jgi:zinc ribbon protein
MAFCTSCGAVLPERSAQFCTKCGARQAGATMSGTTPVAAPAAPGSSSSSVVKILLIVVAGLVILGIVGSIATVLLVRRAARHAKVFISDNGETAHVETPFGTVDTNKDPSKIADKLNIAVYPGAKAQKGSSEVQMMGMHVVTGIFETSDPPEKVAEFYRSEMPNAMYNESNGEHTLISGGHSKRSGMITVHIKEESGATRITIVNNSGKSAATTTDTN